MKLILRTLIVLFICKSMQVQAKETEGKSLPSYSITKVSTDPTLKRAEAVFVFTCLDPTGKKIKRNIKYSFNGEEKTETPDAEGKIKLNVRSGKYKFQFFLDSNYEEIYTDSIKGKGKTKTEITLNFKDATIMMMEDKPVIYLYPATTTNVKVKLDLKGEMLFTYPTYSNGWEVEAQPDGTLKSNNKEYNYLFWEGKSIVKTYELNFSEGFIVETENLLGFLEEKLSAMGLNSKEQQDYITYWYPRMGTNKSNYIHFLFNADYDKYAKLTIEPKPDNVFRVFMVWASEKDIVRVTDMKEQQIPVMQRKGFTVVEWGGAELNTIELK